MRVDIAHSIEAFGREEWNRLFAEELEDWSYYRAVENSGLPEFSWLYFGARDDDGMLRAAVPAFVTDYRLDTTLSGALKRFADWLTRYFPRLLRQKMLSLGSPVSEICHLGFAPDASMDEQQRLLGAILGRAETYAQENRVRMIAVKDASAAQDALWATTAKAHGLRRQPGLPTAYLDVPFASIDEYLATLSKATRKDIRRKLKSTAGLRVEWRSNLDDILPDVMRLYLSTYANAEFNFEELTPDYFRGVPRELGDRAGYASYWLGDKLVAFNLVLHDGGRLLDKFLGMDYTVAREYNLYFYTWIENVRRCIDLELGTYQSGQGLHSLKRRLGSRLSANWLWYRHRIRIVDAIFAIIERVARLDRADPELAALLKESKP
ncbi:MAG: GNAT family N-acetyltransferase [Xanthomonadaceae bacterium]|nr:GNAT family N-acetyltransferase [Xanthomonadaceae bacterium]MDE1885701.1 GNAT family N-acetyltransferase [Xanthomonadaceae bacterium]MDE2084233.1 GNAT family N-acetyltransferase [Xanthomonadaceae bacterium]